MVFICFASFLLSFPAIVDCRVGQHFLATSPEQHQSQVENNFTDGSISNVTAGNGTVALKGSCSLSGPSWDPLLNCFDARDTTPEHLRCKLKKELASATQSAWSSPTVKLRNGSRHHGVVEELLDHVENDGKPFRKCAVVSSSGVLRWHRHGNAIDSADVVFRFNDAPLRGWDKFVGTKESIRVVNDRFPKRVVEHKLATYDFQTNTLYGIVAYAGTPGLYGLLGRYPMTPVKVLGGSFLHSFENTLKSIYDADWFHGGFSFQPTTGAIGMVSAMSQCDEVLAYGMAATRAAGNSPNHYYKEDEPSSIQSRKADENTMHRTFKAEKDLWRRVAQNTPQEIDDTDVAVIPGFSQIKCD